MTWICFEDDDLLNSVNKSMTKSTRPTHIVKAWFVHEDGWLRNSNGVKLDWPTKYCPNISHYLLVSVYSSPEISNVKTLREAKFKENNN